MPTIFWSRNDRPLMIYAVGIAHPTLDADVTKLVTGTLWRHDCRLIVSIGASILLRLLMLLL